MSLSPQLLRILVCPKCKGELEYRESESVLICRACSLSYPVRDDIPVLLVDEAQLVSMMVGRSIDRLCEYSPA